MVVYYSIENYIPRKEPTMSRLVKTNGKSKLKSAKTVEGKRLQDYEGMDVDYKTALIQELIPLGLMHIEEMLQEEVTRLTGEKYKRNGQPGYKRWGSQKGSVYVQDQRLTIKVQRVRNVKINKELPLDTYDRLQQPTQMDEKLLLRVLHGLSTKNYREELKRSFTTTNMIESVMSQIGQKTDKPVLERSEGVDYWKNSHQKQRWVATSLLYIEGHLNKANGYKYLSRLRETLMPCRMPWRHAVNMTWCERK